MSKLPDTAWCLALARLDHMGPARLRAITTGRTAAEGWREVLAGRAAGGRARPALGPGAERIAEAWCRAAAQLDVAALWQRHLDAGIGVAAAGSPELPRVLGDDIDPPSLLTWRGDLGAIAGPRVAIVGTRDCTLYGRDLAFELGRDLAASGVRVVSGLALGIDGAAHAGALDASAAPPIGVVGSGLDVVYPWRNRALWNRVAEHGLLLSEYPMGTPAATWRFPARNRLIAALADIVLVVESHRAGGALLTAEEAIERGRPVMAVPGPVRSKASQGTNKLLFEGMHVCRDADDVLTLLGLDRAAADRAAADRAAADHRQAASRPRPEGAAAKVLDAIGWQPAATEQLLLRTGLPLGELGAHLDELEEAGWLTRRAGWYERAGDPT